MSDVTPFDLARTSTLLMDNVKDGGDILIAKLSEDVEAIFASYEINSNSKRILPLVTGTTVKHITYQ